MRNYTYLGGFQFPELEWKVLEKIASGLSDKETAVLLNKEENTIKNYARRLFAKINVSNRKELISWYKEQVLLEEFKQESVSKP